MMFDDVVVVAVMFVDVVLWCNIATSSKKREERRIKEIQIIILALSVQIIS